MMFKSPNQVDEHMIFWGPFLDRLWGDDTLRIKCCRKRAELGNENLNKHVGYLTGTFPLVIHPQYVTKAENPEAGWWKCCFCEQVLSQMRGKPGEV